MNKCEQCQYEPEWESRAFLVGVGNIHHKQAGECRYPVPYPLSGGNFKPSDYIGPMTVFKDKQPYECATFKDRVKLERFDDIGRRYD